MLEEKRKSSRKASLTRCVVDRLFSHGAPMQSRVINYSDKGLMIELDDDFSPGDAVAVKFEEEAVESVVFGGSICVGMVRWCARQEGMFGALYEAGVELANHYSNRAAPLDS